MVESESQDSLRAKELIEKWFRKANGGNGGDGGCCSSSSGSSGTSSSSSGAQLAKELTKVLSEAKPNL